MGRRIGTRLKKLNIRCWLIRQESLQNFFGVRLKEKRSGTERNFYYKSDGKIKAYEVHDLGIGRNAEELLRKVQAAQYVEEHGEQVCPANWKPGEETLMPSLDLVGML